MVTISELKFYCINRSHNTSEWLMSPYWYQEWRRNVFRHNHVSIDHPWYLSNIICYLSNRFHSHGHHQHFLLDLNMDPCYLFDQFDRRTNNIESREVHTNVIERWRIGIISSVRLIQMYTKKKKGTRVLRKKTERKKRRRIKPLWRLLPWQNEEKKASHRWIYMQSRGKSDEKEKKMSQALTNIICTKFFQCWIESNLITKSLRWMFEINDDDQKAIVLVILSEWWCNAMSFWRFLLNEQTSLSFWIRDLSLKVTSSLTSLRDVFFDQIMFGSSAISVKSSSSATSILHHGSPHQEESIATNIFQENHTQSSSLSLHDNRRPWKTLWKLGCHRFFASSSRTPWPDKQLEYSEDEWSSDDAMNDSNRSCNVFVSSSDGISRWRQEYGCLLVDISSL